MSPSAFDNNGRAVTLNFILVNGPDGWLIADVESPHDSLRMFLAQYEQVIAVNERAEVNASSCERSDA